MIGKLINAVIKNKDRIPYINLSKKNEYLGWTCDFNIILPSGKRMALDLKQEEDLFLLFVLASSWSKTGPWENAAFFTTYLKEYKKTKLELWLDNDFVKNEIDKSELNSQCIVNECKGLEPRRKVSFRSDYYPSVVVLAKNWDEIRSKLEISSRGNNYGIFMDYMATLGGLGAGRNMMRIKIPLILRELRCQKIYSNIPGEFCCVPDKRVITSSKEVGINLPHINSLASLAKASKLIYGYFGNLYDIPLFAYEDVKTDLMEIAP